jgi:hypothetical protein
MAPHGRNNQVSSGTRHFFVKMHVFADVAQLVEQLIRNQ